MEGLQQGGFKKQAVVHDFVLGRALKRGTPPEQGLLVQCFQEEIGFARQVAGIQAKHAQAHAAADIHPYPVGDNGVGYGQHAPDGQSVPFVPVGHDRPGHADGQAGCLVHLVERRCLDVFPSEHTELDALTVGRGVGKGWLGGFRSQFCR